MSPYSRLYIRHGTFSVAILTASNSPWCAWTDLNLPMDFFKKDEFSAWFHGRSRKAYAYSQESIGHLTSQENKLKSFAIGMDVGHSMLKVRAAVHGSAERRVEFQIPTVVCPHIELSNDASRRKGERDTVQVGAHKYFVGDTAIAQASPKSFTGEDEAWVTSPQHDALILAGWRRALEESGEKDRISRVHLVLGLPAKLYKAYKEDLKKHVLQLLTPSLGTKSLKVMISNQGEAPLQWLSLMHDGTINTEVDLDTQSWGTIEIGHLTTDFCYSYRGNMVESASTSCEGVSVVYAAVSAELANRRLPANLDLVDKVVRVKSLKTVNGSIDMTAVVETAKAGLVAAVVNEANRLFAHQAIVMDGIIVAGGGAPLLIEELRKSLPGVTINDEPRMVVAEGFCRLGLMSLSYAAKKH